MIVGVLSATVIITVEPDYEIRNNSSLWVYHTFFNGPKQAQQPNIVWRNLFIKKRKHRIICVDRVLIDKKTKGIIIFFRVGISPMPLVDIIIGMSPDWNI